MDKLLSGEIHTSQQDDRMSTSTAINSRNKEAFGQFMFLLTRMLIIDAFNTYSLREQLEPRVSHQLPTISADLPSLPLHEQLQSDT